MIFLARPAIIAGQVHTEWYRSGYNGPDSKSGVPATVPWVRIPPTPPNSIHPHPGMDVVFCCGWDEKFMPRRGKSHPLRQTASIPIRGWMLFFVVGGMRSLCPEGVNPTHSAGWLRHPGMDVVFCCGWERDEKFMPRRGKACPRCVQPRTQKARNQMPF